MKATKRKDAPVERLTEKDKDEAGAKSGARYASLKGSSTGLTRRPMFRDKAPGEAD